jgi:hypothetical protein
MIPLMLTKSKVHNSVAGDVKVSAISVFSAKRLLGWRITTTDQQSGLKIIA